MGAINYQSKLIAKDKVVSANTVYSDKVDTRNCSGFFLSSKITTSSTGTTHLEIADIDETMWAIVPDSEQDISGNTDYCVDMELSQGAFLRQVVTLVGAGTFTTNYASKVI